MVSLIKLADTTESIFNLGVLLGIFIAICILWIQKTIEFANRPCVVYRDDAKNTYRLVQQRPMPFYAALLFKLLYIDQKLGKSQKHRVGALKCENEGSQTILPENLWPSRTALGTLPGCEPEHQNASPKQFF